MSHFCALVVGPDPQDQLAPYEESPDEGSSYLHFDDVTDKILKEYQNDSTKMMHLPDGRKVFPWDKEFKVKDPNDPLSGLGFSTNDKFNWPGGSVEKETPFKDIYPTFEEFASDWHGFEKPNADGRYGYLTNDNAKWDWNEIGGRWAGYFKLKPYASGVRGEDGLMGSCSHKGDGYADQAKKGDIDFEAMRSEAGQEAAERYTKVMELVQGSLADFVPWSRAKAMYAPDIERAREFYENQRAVVLLQADPDHRFDSLESYCNVSLQDYVKRARDSAITTHAVIRGGKWYEKGEMGWWGIVKDEKDQKDWNEEFTKLLDSLPDDTLLTLIDCHI